MGIRFLQLYVGSIFFIPKCSPLQCYQGNAGTNTAAPSFCTGDACATTFISGERSVQSCISKVTMANGCYGNSTSRVLCTCAQLLFSVPNISHSNHRKDLCNSNTHRITNALSYSFLFTTNISCADRNSTGMCDSPTCMFTNDTSKETCRNFDQPRTFYELYPNAIFLDQTGKYSSNKSSNSVVMPSTSFISFCTLKKCVDHYASAKNYTCEYKDVACYIGDNFNENDVCYGQMCYVNTFNGTTTRGCFEYIYDTLWEVGAAQPFTWLISNRNSENFTIYQFLLLEFYLCNYDLCNRDSVSAKRNNSVHFTKLFTAVMIIVSASITKIL